MRSGNTALRTVFTHNTEVNVYNLQGVLVRKDAPAVNPLQGLAPGVYVAGGRKYVK